MILDDKSVHKSYEWYESRVIHELGVPTIAVYEYLYTYSYKTPKGRVAELRVDEVVEGTGLSKGAVSKALKLLETVDFVVIEKSPEQQGSKRYNLSSYVDGTIGKIECISGVAYVLGIHHKVCKWAYENGYDDPEDVPVEVATRICRDVLYQERQND